jgi:hypothetical protein
MPLPTNEELRDIYGVEDVGNNQCAVEIDVDSREGAEELRDNFGIKIESTVGQGPGGDNPLVRFSGPCEKILEMLLEYDDPDAASE